MEKRKQRGWAWEGKDGQVKRCDREAAGGGGAGGGGSW